MDEETKPLIPVDAELQDSWESWSLPPPDYSIQDGRRGIQILPLPEGKTHHLFFSHSSADQQIVLDWARSLERHHGISCFLPDRDFKPGQPVIKNIEHGMAVCLKIVLVLTPDYMRSGWCDYERFLAFTMLAEERRHCIIPVLLQPCSLPSELIRLNYIDVGKSQNVLDKIMSALKDKCEMRNILPTTFQSVRFEEPNGICHNVSSEKIIQSKIKGSAWHFTELTSFNKERLRNSDMRITEEQFHHLRTSVNASFAMKYHGIFYMGLPLLVFCGNGIVISCCIMVALVALSQWIFRFPALNLLSYVAYSMTALQFLYFAFFAVAWIGIKRKEYIKTKLMALYDETNTSTTERQADADETATHHIHTYLLDNSESFLEWNKLPESRTRRHYTLMNKKCVCEMVEEKLWGTVN